MNAPREAVRPSRITARICLSQRSREQRRQAPTRSPTWRASGKRTAAPTERKGDSRAHDPREAPSSTAHEEAGREAPPRTLSRPQLSATGETSRPNETASPSRPCAASPFIRMPRRLTETDRSTQDGRAATCERTPSRMHFVVTPSRRASSSPRHRVATFARARYATVPSTGREHGCSVQQAAPLPHGLRASDSTSVVMPARRTSEAPAHAALNPQAAPRQGPRQPVTRPCWPIIQPLVLPHAAATCDAGPQRCSRGAVSKAMHRAR